MPSRLTTIGSLGWLVLHLRCWTSETLQPSENDVAKRGVEMVAKCPLLKGIPCHLLMAGKANQDNPKKMDWARSTLEKAGFSVESAILPGDPETVIARQIQYQEIDLLIMGAFNRAWLHNILHRSPATAVLRSATVPTLLLR